MILGDKCTRNCTFCAVGHGPKDLPDAAEPLRVAKAVKTMGLKYCVITSVTRDDLDDGGASHFIQTITEIRNISPYTKVEILIPDLQGNWKALKSIVAAKPDILNHNIETVPRLYQTVRPLALYERSLQLIAKIKEFCPSMITKSGIMVGLGESMEEIHQVMDDLLQAGCDILTIGQYLQPSRDHLAVKEFVTPESFAALEKTALKKGFIGVASGPTVRSSYEAGLLHGKVVKLKH